MNQNIQKQLQLPIIQVKNHQKQPQGDIMGMLKQKRKQINKRILKTQQNEEDVQIEQNHDSHQNFRLRLITDIPIYSHHRHSIEKIHSFDQSQSESQKTQPKIIRNTKQNQKSETMDEKRKTQFDSLHGNLSILQELRTSSHQIDVLQSKNMTHKQQNTQHYEIKPINIKQTKKIEDIFLCTPINPKARNQENTQPLKNYLFEHNMFFSKINSVVALCIIKLNKLFVIQKKKTLFKMNEQIDSFFIILQGKVKISNPDSRFKKICQAGQTLFQEVLFDSSPKKLAFETARTVTKSFVVEIKVKNYYKMKQEMIRYGYKVHFSEMESLIKRNYIMKNWIRSQKDKL